MANATECARIGHVEADGCACARCGAPLHRYEVVHRKRVVLRSETVNPEADPGALYLSADFQPDWDFGRTQTVYETTTLLRCGRCGARETERMLDSEVDA